MARNVPTRRTPRVFPLAIGGLAAIALAVPAAASAATSYPTDGGRLTISDAAGQTHAIWPDGSHRGPEFFSGSLPYTQIGSWQAAGKKIAVIDPGHNDAAYIFSEGNPTPTLTVPALNGENIVGAALGQDGTSVVTSSDQGVTVRNNGTATNIYAQPAGTVVWSSEGGNGTIVWDGYPDSDRGNGILGGFGGSALPADNPVGNGGIWAKIRGGVPTQVVTDQDAFAPSISQDGKLLAYASGGDIWYLDLSDVNAQPQKLAASSAGVDDWPAVSPDGTKIAFVSGATTPKKIVVAPVAGGATTTVERDDDQAPATVISWQPAVKANPGTVFISGTAEVGQTLTATEDDPVTGTAPVEVSYAWERCDNLGGCTTVPGATSDAYTVTADDTGSTLRVKRQAINAAGGAVVTSLETATVTAGGNTPVDSTPPGTPSFTDTPLLTTTATTATFKWNGAEAGGKFQCQLIGDVAPSTLPWADCTTPFTTPQLAAGPHAFRVRQVDDADNAGDYQQYDWTITAPNGPDVTPPLKPTLTMGPGLEDENPTPTFTWHGAEAGGTFQCSVTPLTGVQSDDSWVECSSPYTTPKLAAGQYKFRVRQLDDAHNAGPADSFTWTVVAPTDETPEVTPPVPTPTPTPTPPPVEPTPTATPVAPVATPVPPKAPALTATIGGTSSGTKAGTSSQATINVAKESVGVGCSITGTVLKSCKVDLYADVTGGAAARAAASAKQVLVGTGIYESKAGSAAMDVRIELNATGKALLRKHPAGLQVSVAITGTPVSGAPLKATGTAKLVNDRAALTVGGFATDSAVLTKQAKAQLRAVAQLGKVATIRCVGHTDGSTDDASYLKRLGERRAQAVCTFLARHGVKAGKRTLVSKGATAPVASNATQAGRAKNRRVQVTIIR